MNNPQIEKLQKLLATNNLVGAEDLCRKAIHRNSNDVNMIALLGTILMKSGRLDEAERRLQRAIKLAPKFAKPYDDLAVLNLRRNEFKKADSLFRKAIELLPDLESSWLGLVHALRGQGDLTEAKNVCGQILARNPDDLNAIRLMAVIASDEGLVAEAGDLLQSAVAKAPDSIKAVSDLARFCADHHQYSQAIDLFRRAVELEPRNPKFHFSLGRYLFTIGFSKEALKAFDAGLALDPESQHGRSGRLYALRALGRIDEVIADYRACIQEGVNIGESWWSLSSLRTYPFSDDELEQMKSFRQADDITASDSVYLDFAMGKALDDRHRYDEAWQFYTSGNNTRRRSVCFDGKQFESEIDAIIAAVDEAVVARGEGVDPQEVTPVFIVGMPRSGSTLIEQVLASHSAVEATTELPYMMGLARRYMLANNINTPPAIVGLDANKLADIGNQYLKASKLHRTASKPWFIDKMPNNFLCAGLIAMTLPNAKIIDARRNPLDTCVGNYRQWFATGKEFSYDLDELGDYFLQYHRIMRHWNDVMPGRVLCVNYEDVVEDTEKEVRRMLEWCELPWEEDCLRFYESDRVVTTASSEQARQPVYKSAVGFWKHYEPYLDELIEKLRPATG